MHGKRRSQMPDRIEKTTIVPIPTVVLEVKILRCSLCDWSAPTPGDVLCIECRACVTRDRGVR